MWYTSYNVAIKSLDMLVKAGLKYHFTRINLTATPFFAI